MAVYYNLTPDSPLASVEFTPVSDGNFSFFTVSKPEQKDLVKSWLGRLGQETLAETQVDGKSVFVTRGDKTQHDLLGALKLEGDHFQLHHESKGLLEGAWMVRSALGMTGQGLQLTSSLMRGRKDWGLFTFAVTNIAANTVNFIYGSQKSEDIHRLHFLKDQVNDKLEPYITKDETLPGVDDQRADLRKHPDQGQSVGTKFNNWMKGNSVRVGELGLRYLGAFGLAFPTDRWGLAKEEFKANGLNSAYHVSHASRLGKDLAGVVAEKYKQIGAKETSQAMKESLQKDLRDIYRKQPANLVHYAGIGSIAGKTLALTSLPEDPFNPKPKSAITKMREKFTFRTGGWIEAVAFGTLSYDAFKNGKIKYPEKGFFSKIVPKNMRGKEGRDYLSGTGAALFTLAYITRHWAKYAEKKVDMEELYAHITDGLAQMPQEKLPQLMADTAAYVKDHFKEKHLDFGKVFTQLMTETYRYHQVALASNVPDKDRGDTPAVIRETSAAKKAEPSHLERIQRESITQAELGR